MDLMPVDDENLDGPIYGGPVVELPPDTSVGAMFETLTMPNAWHCFGWIKDELWKVETGNGVKVAVLDTGYTKHEYGPDPIAAKSFINGQSWRDGNGHGCIAPTDEIYTSNCGLQCIKTFFDRMSGMVYFNTDGSTIKDISRYNINTTSLKVVKGKMTAVRSRITHVHKLNYSGEMFHVDVNGERLSLTPWHPVYISTSSRGDIHSVSKRRADELKVGDRVCLVPSDSIGISDELVSVPFRDGWLPISEDVAFWLGLVATDGHLMKGQKAVSFSSARQEHIELFNSLSLSIFGKTPSVYNYKSRPNASECRLFCSDAWKFASDVGIPIGNKSRTICLPERIAKSPKSVIASFVAGCMEGNGCVSSKQGAKDRLICGSKSFAQSISRLLKSLGIRSSMSEQSSEKSTFGGGVSYVVSIGTWKEMLEKLRVKKPFLNRSAKKNNASEIKAITKSFYEGELYDLTVEGTHNYVANGCIVSNTHCIGSVLCRRDTSGNSIGLAPDADLIVGKVLSDQGSGGSDGIAAGIRWAADQGAHVISMSLGGGGSDSGTNQAIDYAWSKGCIVNAAAGNSGYNGSNTIGWPAKYQNCLCCGAYAENGSIANFSSGGRELDWACPGQNVISFSTSGTGFRPMSGTSMATPWGSGLLACLVGKRLRQGLPLFTSAQQVRDYFDSVLKDAGQPGFDVRFGKGIADGKFLVAAIIAELVAA